MYSRNVLFVEPTGTRSNVFSRFMNIPLLGPVYLATIAKQAGYDASIFNENIMHRHISSAELAEADVLCVSCITSTIDRGKQIADIYRSVRALKGKKSRTIIGGIHASMIPQDVSRHFDQVVIGEAESVFLDILSEKNIEHIVRGARCDNLDSLPFPDYSLLKGWSGKGHLPVMTSRGCPYDCNFCSVTKMFGKGYRAQSPERVLRELEQLKRGFMFFVDDNFAVNIDRSAEILDGMRTLKIKRQWSAQVRTDITHKPEFIGKMKKAGCYVAHIGFESINEESLLDMKKKQTVDDISRSIEVFHANGIRVHGMFILGNDPDLKDVFKMTSEFAKKSRIDSVQFAVLTPLPGTELYSRIEHEGRLLHKQWSYYDGLHVVHSPKNMSAGDLQKGMIKCFSDFYSYSGAAMEALDIVYKGAISLAQAFAGGGKIPSLASMIIKIAGKNIIRQWTRENAPYISYLRKAPLAAAKAF